MQDERNIKYEIQGFFATLGMTRFVEPYTQMRLAQLA
jgi:hypothetical protein